MLLLAQFYRDYSDKVGVDPVQGRMKRAKAQAASMCQPATKPPVERCGAIMMRMRYGHPPLLCPLMLLLSLLGHFDLVSRLGASFLDCLHYKFELCPGASAPSSARPFVKQPFKHLHAVFLFSFYRSTVGLLESDWDFRRKKQTV